jgi:hypothetical protein
MRRGIVASIEPGRVAIRDLQTWHRFFCALTATADPALVHGATVIFQIDTSPDPSGRRAKAVTVVAAPDPPVASWCRTCGRAFQIDAVDVAHLASQRLDVPSRCGTCRPPERRRTRDL